RLICKELPGIRFGVGVPSEHVNSPFPSLTENCRDAGLVLDGNSDRIDAASNPVFDQFVLFGGLEPGRTVPDQFNSQLVRSLFSPHPGTHEIRVALSLRHDGDHEAMRVCGDRSRISSLRCMAKRMHKPYIRSGNKNGAGKNGYTKNRDLTVLHCGLL